jgi:hypothetical protein
MSILDEYNHGSNGYHGYSLVIAHFYFACHARLLANEAAGTRAT